MKLLLTSDWHLRSTNPENRIDDFPVIQKNKIEQILQIATENKCNYILQAGDFMDTPRPSFSLIEEYVSLFRKYDIGNKLKILHVYGQHDEIFRNKEKTATKLLNFLGYLEEISKLKKLSSDVDLYGVSWGDEIPEIQNIDNFNILLIHKTIINKQQFPGQEDYLQSDKLFKHGFDIVIAGDNHNPVFYQHEDQTILGCGTIVRKTIAEAGLFPHIYILTINENTLTYSLNKIELKYEPAEKVFNSESLNKETKEENKKLQEFIEAIKNNQIGSSLDFKKNLENLLIKTEKPIKDIILKELEQL